MGRKTDGEKVDALEKLTATPEERVNTLRADIAAAKAERQDDIRAFADYRREAERTAADLRGECVLLRRELDDGKRERTRWGERLWQLVMPLLAGLAGARLGLKP